MSEAQILDALAQQWPVVAVLLVWGAKAIRAAGSHVSEISSRITAMDEHARASAKKHDDLLSEMVHLLRAQGERTDRHSHQIKALTGEFESLRGRVDHLETSATRRAS